MSSVKIRLLRESELDDLRKLWTQSGLSFKPKGRDSLANLQRQRREDPSLFLGAFDEDRMVGAVIASDDGRKAWINRLAVAPEARGRRVATTLIARCESILRRRGRHIFCVHIELDNPESMRLFESVGYKKEDEILYFTKRDSADY